jgi:GAF domain-containing protein
MIKGEELIGAITIFRQELRPFSNEQIALVSNFAAQAVIAIENARLLNELRQSLEQQTATSEVLQVISSSPGDLQPVFESLLRNATQLCKAKFGTLYLREEDGVRLVAAYDMPAKFSEVESRAATEPFT